MSEIVWGPEIAVDGKRPEWLSDDDKFVPCSGDTVDGCIREWSMPYTSDGISNWRLLDAIRLPADHPHYATQPTVSEMETVRPTQQDAISGDVVGRMAGAIRELAARDNGDGTVSLYDIRRSVQDAVEIVALLPEPVDADLIEARECVAKVYEDAGRDDLAKATRDGKQDNRLRVQSALAAIRRGRALAAEGR